MPDRGGRGRGRAVVCRIVCCEHVLDDWCIIYVHARFMYVGSSSNVPRSTPAGENPGVGEIPLPDTAGSSGVGAGPPPPAPPPAVDCCAVGFVVGFTVGFAVGFGESRAESRAKSTSTARAVASADAGAGAGAGADADTRTRPFHAHCLCPPANGILISAGVWHGVVGWPTTIRHYHADEGWHFVWDAGVAGWWSGGGIGGRCQAAFVFS